MQLGIKGRRALVCGASRGLGRGIAEALAAEGVHLVLNARNEDTLIAAAQSIKTRFDVTCDYVATDISTEEGQAKTLAACSRLDILITNAGGPAPGLWSDWNRDDFIRAFDANLLSPIALMKAVLPDMIAQKWGRIINITSQSVRAPIPQLGLSNTARAGLTGFVAGTARQVAQHNVTINNMLPGIHDTDRAAFLDKAAAQQQGINPEQARQNRENTIPAQRYGTAEEFGAMAAFLCSEHAGFIVGQNILLDGGATNLTM